MRKRLFLHSATVLALVSLGAANADWKLAKETPQTKIYTRENQGEKIKELKVITQMDATVDELVSIYLDGDNHNKWYPACESAKVVKKVNDSVVQIYHKINNPWPVQDRDYVIEVTSTKDAGTGEALIEYKDVKGEIGGDKDCVRMKKIQGSWKFAPGKDGKTQVTYVLNFDPGGSTPASFINMSLSSIGTSTFDSMTEYAKTRRAASAQ